MKNFIKKCLWFFAFASMILLVNFFINRQFIKKIPVINTTTLIAGDSRVMTAINPKLFSSAINIAQNSESYLITYYKLKYLLPKNEKIKQVIIGFSYPSFSGYMDSLYSNDIATADIFSRIYPIITPKQLFPLKVDVWKYYSVYLKNNLLYPKVNQYPFMGSFTELKYG
ncbi:MAG: hypothetical protein IT239_01265, partial [Bacteroidia bacterium]|nr:hypothetical protein [Bacteroidia bacterium]